MPNFLTFPEGDIRLEIEIVVEEKWKQNASEIGEIKDKS
jgi:hypothetical protein